MTRRSFSRKDRVRLFGLHKGLCYLCGWKIADTDKWEIEHVVPWELTRDDGDDNLRLVHAKCHKAKTAKDIRELRKSDRIAARHFGFKPPSRRPLTKPERMKYDWSRQRYVREEPA